MSNDNIPPGDDEFHTFQETFSSPIVANPATFGLTAAQGTALQAKQTLWKVDFAAHNQATLDARKARQAKDDARAAYEPAMRADIQIMHNNPVVTPALLQSVGVTPHSTAHVASPVPATRPVAHIEHSGPLRHILHWVDETTPHTRKKPHGVHGAEVLLKIGDPAPVDEKTCAHMGIDTASPYTLDFDATDVGKTAYWFTRWVNTRGEKGPLGALVSAKING